MATAGDGDAGLPVAGWYPDAANPDRERLWTGSRWLDWIRPARADRVESVPVAWHPDATHPGFERLWSGEMWTEEMRRAAPTLGPASGAGSPVSTAAAPGAQSVQAPATLPPVQQTVSYHDDHPPDRLGGLANLLGIAFLVVIAAAIAELVADQIYIGIESDILGGGTPSLSHIESVTSAVHTTHWIAVVVDGLTAILFVIWFYRAYRNLVRIGISDLRFGPGWAIGGWFIPIFNLIRQKQIANDTWKASASAGTIGLARRWEIALPSVLNWWWGTWILGGLLVTLGNGAVQRANEPLIQTLDSLRRERTGVWFTQIGLVVLIAAAVLAYLYVRDVSRMQDESFEATVPGAGGAPAHAYAVTGVGPTPGVPIPPAATKTCPRCAEQVKAEALVCRYCGHQFDAVA